MTGRAHKKTCPLNPRFLSQGQKCGNGPKGDDICSRVGKGVASKSSAVRRGSDTLSGPPVKKAKVVTHMSTHIRRPITPTKSPVSRPSRLGKSRARLCRDLMCVGSKTKSSNDIEADEHSTNIEAGLKKVPKTTDVALSPKCPPTDIHVEDVAIVGCDPPKDFDFSLPPTPEWREEAIKCIEKFSGRTISPVVAESNVIIPCEEILPHSLDKILGDGNCLFRALAKEITGSQKHHFEVRLAFVNFIQCDKQPPTFSQYVVKDFHKQSELTNPSLCQAACKEYIEHSKMSKLHVWGSDIEIRAAATMLQVDVAVFL